MDFDDFQRKLSCQSEANCELEFSFSQILSVPLDLVVSIVKNRREADLLLKVSESSSSLDLLTQTYEMFALRAQALQEAWNGLWLAQEPHLVPAIPLIGLEMSGVNSGRSLLLLKLDKEFSTLKELGKQLCHYIDVNHSLVEELRMEGIERLAANKLLLAEIEKELVRRITHICNNKSMRELSSMRQFLCQLRKPTPTTIEVAMDESKDCGNSTMNGSCSTEKVTTEGSSEAQRRSLDITSGDRDAISPGSQSIASKCVSTQGDNMHPPFLTTPINELPAEKVRSHSVQIAASSKGLPLGTGELVGTVDNKVDVRRNHSSSASEERLPKTAQSGLVKLPRTSADNDAENQKDICERAEMRSRELPTAISKQPDVNGNGTLLYRDRSTGFLRGLKEGSSKLELTQEQAKADFKGVRDADPLAARLHDDNVASTSSPGVFKLFDPDQMFRTLSPTLPGTQPDIKGSKRKRQVESEVCIGGTSGESMDLVARNRKRILVQVSSETIRETTHSSASTFMTNTRFLQPIEESSQILLCTDLDDKEEEKVNTATDLCLPCSCDPSNSEGAVDTKTSIPGGCKACGCFLAQAWIHSNQTASEQVACIEQSRASESPIPATQ